MSDSEAYDYDDERHHHNDDHHHHDCNGDHCEHDHHHEHSEGNLNDLRHIFPDHGSIYTEEHRWLHDFREENRAQFDLIFEGKLNHLHYRRDVPEEAVQAALDFYASYVKEEAKSEAFQAGLVANLLKELHPQLEELGHHYDDLWRMLDNLFSEEEKPLWRMVGVDPGKVHELEAQTGLHIHSGKSMQEVATVVAVAIGAALISDKAMGDVPYSARVAFEALGVWPLFNSLIAGNMEHAFDHLKEGKNIDDAVKYGLETMLLVLGVLREEGSHELYAAAIMAGIISAVGNIQTNAAERQLEVLDGLVAGLPETAAVIHGDHTHETAVDSLKRGNLIQLRRGDIAPVDVHIRDIEDADTVLVDASHASGDAEQAVSPGDHLPQGSVILDDTLIEAEVTREAAQSTIRAQVEQLKQPKGSRRQSLAKQIGNYWAMGSMAGTLGLGAYAFMQKPDAEQGEGEAADSVSPVWQRRVQHAADRMAKFGTLSSPCNILVATMVEGSSARKLANHGIMAMDGDALISAYHVDKYCIDFTGTCSKGMAFKQGNFIHAATGKAEPVKSEQIMQDVMLLGYKADSQHLMQKALRRELLSEFDAEELPQAIARFEQVKEVNGQGVAGLLNDAGHAVPVRIGRLDFVLEDGDTRIEGQHLETLRDAADTNASLSFVRYGDYVGILEFEDEIRADIAEAMAALNPENVHILTGKDDREYVLGYTNAWGIPEDQVHTGLRPNDKPRIIEDLQAEGYTVAMIGDGKNDALAMQQADVSFGMKDTIDAVTAPFVDFAVPDLVSVAPLRNLSRRVDTTSKDMLALAVGYTGVTAGLNAVGKFDIPIVGAAIAHEGMSVTMAVGSDKLADHYVNTYQQECRQVRGGEEIPEVGTWKEQMQDRWVQVTALAGAGAAAVSKPAHWAWRKSVERPALPWAVLGAASTGTGIHLIRKSAATPEERDEETGEVIAEASPVKWRTRLAGVAATVLGVAGLGLSAYSEYQRYCSPSMGGGGGRAV